MRAFDVVQQLAARLPLFSDAFTTNVSVSSLTQAAGIATAVTTTPHGISAGQQACIVGAKTALAISSLTRVGTVGTLVTVTPHDLTKGYSTTVEIADAVEANFNGTFTLINVPDRYTVTFVIANSGALTATGSPVLLNGANYLAQYNGLKTILSAPTTTSFTFAVPTGLASPARGTIVARTLPRISALLQEDMVIAAYTAQPTGNAWAFVVLGDVTASKSRDTETDATSNLQRGEEFRVRLLQPMTVYICLPTSQETAGRSVRDRCEELLKPLCQSILMKRFDSLLTIGMKGPLQFVGHGFASYQSGFYVHAYQFVQVADMSFGDTVGYDEDVAFRNIALTMNNNIGTGIVKTAAINLDGG